MYSKNNHSLQSLQAEDFQVWDLYVIKNLCYNLCAMKLLDVKETVSNLRKSEKKKLSLKKTKLIPKSQGNGLICLCCVYPYKQQTQRYI